MLNGGGVAVSEQVAGPFGYSTAPCAAAPGTQWYFAHGSTASGDLLDLMLFNPGAAPAVVDVALATSSSGYIQPPAYQGVEVPPGALVVENVSDHAINDPSVSTTVTALSGSVVAGQLEQLGSAGQGGLSVLLGAPSPERTWSFPYNVDEAGETVAFNVFNPTTTAAAVSMEIDLQQGSAEPLKIRVPALSTVAVLAENQTRIPAGSVYGAEFVTTKGAGHRRRTAALGLDADRARSRAGRDGGRGGRAGRVGSCPPLPSACIWHLGSRRRERVLQAHPRFGLRRRQAAVFGPSITIRRSLWTTAPCS